MARKSMEAGHLCFDNLMVVGKGNFMRREEFNRILGYQDGDIHCDSIIHVRTQE